MSEYFLPQFTIKDYAILQNLDGFVDRKLEIIHCYMYEEQQLSLLIHTNSIEHGNFHHHHLIGYIK